MERKTAPATALAEAERRAEEVARRSSRWYARYLVAFGVGMIGLVTWAGFVDGALSGILFACVAAAFIGAISLYATQQPILRRGLTRRHLVIIGSWLVLYMAALFVGGTSFPREIAYWLPAGVVVSLPAFAGAYLEARR